MELKIDKTSNTLVRLGSAIHYYLEGREDAPVIAFTHGAALDHIMFEPQIQALCDAGYRVLRWDMRGHGLSKPIGSGFNVHLVADDLITLLDHLGIETATFIGHSFGGYVTQEIMFRYPERTQALGVIGCTNLARKPSPLFKVANHLIPYLLPLGSLESFRKQTVENVSVKDAVTAYAYDATGSLSKAEFIKIITASMACLGKDAGYGSDYTIPRPFLLTHGERDTANRGIFSKSAPIWAKREPLCTYRVIPDAGHTANQDNPQAFNKILLDFLSAHVPL